MKSSTDFWLMAVVTGRDIASLRTLAVRPARECYFGDDVMATSSPSGKGGGGLTLVQLEVVYMSQIKKHHKAVSGHKNKRRVNLRQFGLKVSQALSKSA